VRILFFVISSSLPWFGGGAGFDFGGGDGQEGGVVDVDLDFSHMLFHFSRHIFLPRLSAVPAGEVDRANVDLKRFFGDVVPSRLGAPLVVKRVQYVGVPFRGKDFALPVQIILSGIFL